MTCKKKTTRNCPKKTKSISIEVYRKYNKCNLINTKYFNYDWNLIWPSQRRYRFKSKLLIESLTWLVSSNRGYWRMQKTPCKNETLLTKQITRVPNFLCNPLSSLVKVVNYKCGGNMYKICKALDCSHSGT